MSDKEKGGEIGFCWFGLKPWREAKTRRGRKGDLQEFTSTTGVNKHKIITNKEGEHSPGK